MVLLAGSTGLRRSKMIALTRKNANAMNLEVTVLYSWVRNRFGDRKNTHCDVPFLRIHQAKKHSLRE
jgi:hypothetical protein